MTKLNSVINKFTIKKLVLNASGKPSDIQFLIEFPHHDGTSDVWIYVNCDRINLTDRLLDKISNCQEVDVTLEPKENHLEPTYVAFDLRGSYINQLIQFKVVNPNNPSCSFDKNGVCKKHHDKSAHSLSELKNKLIK